MALPISFRAQGTWYIKGQAYIFLFGYCHWTSALNAPFFSLSPVSHLPPPPCLTARNVINPSTLVSQVLPDRFVVVVFEKTKKKVVGCAFRDR